ncbi:MAG TPA: DNA translocase FtsK [Candidatus Sulfomarinibacteraceae bacterium]|nr:DNA translocase FtsK [Candidatus Sulfomarinibacteraceae bacterium]
MARSRSKQSASSSQTWDETVIQGLIPLRVEVVGLTLLVLSGITMLGLLNLTHSSLLDLWVEFCRRMLGWGVYPLFLLLGAGGAHLALRRVGLPYRIHITQVLGVELMLLAALPLTYQLGGGTLPDAYQGRAGGLVGWALAAPLLDFLGPLLTATLFAMLFIWGAALAARVSWSDLLAALSGLSALFRQWASELEPPPRPPRAPQPTTSGRARQPLLIDDSPRAPQSPAPAGAPDPRLPPIRLLERGAVINMTDAEIRRKKEVIEQTLLDFGLRGEVTEIRRGPSVTQFGVTPGYLPGTGPDGEPLMKKVRVSRIAALQKDFALALEVPRLRIEAPVPGRGIVGLEVPNARANVVRLRTVLESQAFSRLNSPLAVALGQGVSGAPLAIDLAKMPHLLIAGTTGSGKSVCLNAFISCLVFRNPPERLKLVMIDPKKVELIRFNGIPHLLGNVEVEHDRVTGVLRWIIVEMDRRYEAFAQIGAKNLAVYNEKIARRDSGKPLPHIAVFIDELADLMAMYGEEVERALCRLAQMARATGIHLVVATQRPSTNVITGLIKANFPARISFAVASNTDSRVILDTAGAEQLLGQGDMLFLSPEAGEPVRVQGCFVSDNEIERLVSHWQRVIPEVTPEEAPWEHLIARRNFIDEKDEMLEEAIALAQKVDTISTSLIQRRLRVGFPRAARLMEALYDMGLVEDPREGGKTRRTYVDEDDDPLDEFLAEHD